MFHLYSEQHDDFCVLVPSLSISRISCECCGEKGTIVALDFLIWSIGIGWQSH